MVSKKQDFLLGKNAKIENNEDPLKQIINQHEELTF